MQTFYTEEELRTLNIKSYGQNVKISRNAVLYHPQLLEIGSNVRIDDFCVLSGKIQLGNYIHIAQFCALYGGQSGIIMKDFSGLSSKGTIYATSNDYSGESMTNPTVPDKYAINDKDETVILGKHVVVGCGSVVLPGVTIGEGSAVGAMSLCAKALEPWGIYVGAPAKFLKPRSKTLLKLEEQLKKEIGIEKASE
jgi:acetyltransferase-like isoleucine patch superfamily enzyme